MKNYFYHIQLFIYRFILLILFFTISRLVFYIFNFNYFTPLGVWEFLKIMSSGIRFDLSSIFYFNLLFISLHLIPGDFKNNKKYQNILFFIFITVNSILLATNIIDCKFFDFEHKRLTLDIFSSVWIGEDFKTLLPQFFTDYWYLLVIWIVLIFGLIKLYPKLDNNKISSYKLKLKNILLQIPIFIFLIGLGIVSGRGGFQLKPLRVIHAAQYTTAKNIPLVLNTPFTIMKTMGTKSVQARKYFASEELDSIYSPILKFTSSKKSNPNVVLIIMESFSREYIGALNNGIGYTPFLDSLIKEGLIFTKAFANGKRSIEALPSIIAGLPALNDNAYITSSFSSNKINSIASTLKTEGYSSAFFHGGKNGTMGFDQFVNIAGFDKYFGLNEYPNKTDYDGNWGIYDEEYFQYFGKELNKFKEPFFATIFSLTSHHPYEIPKKYEGKFPKGNLNIHESIGYADYSLKRFFSLAKSTSWYKNTLFVIVADHTAQSESQYYGNKLGNYAIPILFFHPNDPEIKGNSEIIAQQSDIFPSILDYVGYRNPIVCFGNSLFNTQEDHFSINYINGIYQLIDKDYLIQFDGEKSIGLFNIKTDSLLQNNLVNEVSNVENIENKLKAIIQSYQERLIKNQLSPN